MVFPARSALFNHNILNTKAISHFQANHILIRFVFPPLKGSEIDRSFSFSKLDKCFGDVGLNTAGNNRQIVSAPVQEPAQTPGKADSPLLAGLGGLFSASSSLADDTPDNPGERKKKKKKRHLKL